MACSAFPLNTVAVNEIAPPGATPDLRIGEPAKAIMRATDCPEATTMLSNFTDGRGPRSLTKAYRNGL